MKYVQVTAAAAAVLTLAACGSSAAPVAAKASSVPSAAASSSAASSSPALPVMSAREVILALASRGLPLKLTRVFTAATDPNHLLGRPGEYTSKADFADSRIHGSEVAGGGSVEVFASPAEAIRRAAYIQGVVQAAPILGAEYDYVTGGVLLRVSGKLTPAQAIRYKAALHEATGLPASQPSPAS